MNGIIAFCGLICTECQAYIATQTADPIALEQVAASWRKEYDAPGITVESVICDGCLTDEGRKCAHCAECKIRACAVGQGVPNCAYCADYGCQELEGFFSLVPDARIVLDGVRLSL